ncbi:MAG TPA: inositol monophosphatase family protein, partial [Jatrophihabitans sp.]|nr:inositol monophosphatase family protein [Jatrophihabitans sp.]
MDDHELAAELARTAGAILTTIQSAGLLAGRELGDAGDAVAHSWLAGSLTALRPDDGLLSEESFQDGVDRTDQRRLWIVDPLDGTREFSENRTDWAVHVALVIAGAPGPSAVALPGLGLVLSTAAVRPPAPPAGPLRIAVSRSRPPALAGAVAEQLGAELVPMGSAGYKAMAVVRGEVHAYLHAGGQYEWDSAAPVGVAVAAGLHASRIDG